MKYFIDTEFIEGFHKPMFGKRRHFIDLISIGIVAEDGREYYAISTEFNHKDASRWVKDNVIKELPRRYFNGTNVDEAKLWKSNEQIADDIKNFCAPQSVCVETDINVLAPMYLSKQLFSTPKHEIRNPIFYGYYSDYDWVLFCSLFGTMMDLPKGFPMYCIDLKQTKDEVVGKYKFAQGFGLPPSCAEHQMAVSPPNSNEKERIVATDIYIDRHPKYPSQSNEHNALDDARWNKKLYEFLQII